ncbi:hypothetical protein [Enterococcus sp. DIV0756]|uniref:hypothetical protein n=1 Tax=Enterococcus sp. DIV0756 TaxID=2774636 RepID=UPI003F280375
MKFTATNDDRTLSAKISLNKQAKESKKKIKLPKSTDTISVEEYTKIMGDAQYREFSISDEEFNELLDAINQEGSFFIQEQIEQIKQTYKPYLTEEQYKHLEEALDQKKSTMKSGKLCVTTANLNT